VFNIYFFRISCRLWNKVENIAEPERPHVKMWRMRIACWTPKATNTHSEYIIRIAFPQQRWLQERASVALYVHCLFWYDTNIKRLICLSLNKHEKTANKNITLRYVSYVISISAPIIKHVLFFYEGEEEERKREEIGGFHSSENYLCLGHSVVCNKENKITNYFNVPTVHY
jgi:hypothetical protein